MATKKTSAKVSATKKDVKATAEKKITVRFTKAKETAEQLWLAYLGVIGQSIDFAQSKYDSVNGDIKGNVAKGKAFVEDLVDRGEEVQGKVDTQIEKTKEIVEEKVLAVKSGITKALDVPSHLKILSDKLEVTSEKIEEATS